jgi:hypothetical protein
MRWQSGTYTGLTLSTIVPKSAASTHITSEPAALAKDEAELGEKDLDAGHDNAPLWFYAIDDVLENAAPPGFACRVFDVELNSTSRNESGLFCEADKDTAWRDAMQDEIKMIEDNDT